MLLAEAEAAREGYIFEWTLEIQLGWTLTIYLEPSDLGRPIFLVEETGITLTGDRDTAKRVEEGRALLAFMSASTWSKVVHSAA